MFASVGATIAEKSTVCPGDKLVTVADVVMDRGFTVPGAPEQVWPWLQQLGKHRAGWYLPQRIERMLPRSRQAAHRVQDEWQHLRVGDTIPDYGGRKATFVVAEIEAPRTLVYESHLGRAHVSWAIVVEPAAAGTRIHLRLRIGPLRRPWIARTGGELFDALTIAGMAAGLRERLQPPE